MARDIVRDFGYLTLGTRLRRLGELLQANTQAVMTEFGVTIPAAQYPFLAALDREGPLTVGELAEAVGITQPGATRTIAQLVEAGLVETSVSDEDQRRRCIALTAVGGELVTLSKQTVWPKVETAVREACADLDGPLLDQITALENNLAATPLLQRVTKQRNLDESCA